MAQANKRGVYTIELEDGSTEQVKGIEFEFEGQAYWYTDVFHGAELTHLRTGCFMGTLRGRPSVKKAVELLEKLQQKHGRDAFNETLVMAGWDVNWANMPA